MKFTDFIQGTDIEVNGFVENATDFLQAIKLVDAVTLEAEEYKVVNTELVVGEGEPFLAILLEA